MDSLVEALRIAAGDADEIVKIIVAAAVSKGVDVQAMTGHSEERAKRLATSEHSATMRQAADTLERYRDALETAKGYVHRAIDVDPPLDAIVALDAISDVCSTALSISVP